MADAATISKLAKAAKSYAKDVGALVAAGSTTEATYYPAVKWLIAAALKPETLAQFRSIVLSLDLHVAVQQRALRRQGYARIRDCGDAPHGSSGGAAEGFKRSEPFGSAGPSSVKGFGR